MRRLVAHAYREVAYYRKAFGDAEVTPADIRTLDDLARLPITTKSDLQGTAIADRLAADAGKEDFVVHETSGSTGEAMRICRRHAEERFLFGRRLRALILSGLRPWDRRLILGATPKQFLPHRLGLFRLSGIPLEVEPLKMIEEIERCHPTVLKGPPTTLELLLDDYSERLAALPLRRVFTGAEHLSPGTRARLERTCGSPVIDLYGATECNLIAWQCLGCGAYHTCDDAVIVEVMCGDRPARPGEDGEVVITALHSYFMPFIRYRVGDVVRVPADRPACRIGFGAIERVQGRAIDYLQFPDGTRLSPYMVMNKLDAIKGMRRYEVRQVSPLQIEVRYQLLAGTDSGPTGARIREECQRLFPGDTELQFERVESFNVSPTEKRRFITTQCSPGAEA
ncbi:MAG: phenylacetate--CoA ligase family protein [Chromatiales bacterium]|nr:MAG: phenylacetate--CoA ligase family protein [Chromatiales bacterium]